MYRFIFVHLSVREAGVIRAGLLQLCTVVSLSQIDSRQKLHNQLNHACYTILLLVCLETIQTVAFVGSPDLCVTGQPE